MNQQDSISLFQSIYPGFFERDYIKNLPEQWVCAELIMKLDEFDSNIYQKRFDSNITFGFYEGDLEELQGLVSRVVSDWAQYYGTKGRIYCGYMDGKVASFCLIENKGVHTINGHQLKVGGPGCVGTLPEFRDRGIGLTMVKNVTRILKEEGFDYSYIHFTGEAQWYEKLGYKTSVKWCRNGIIEG